MNTFIKSTLLMFLFAQISLSQTSVEWEQIHIPPDTGNVANAMVVAPDGSVYITGQSMFSTNGGLTGWYWLTVKYDNQGNLIWENIYQSEFLSSDNQAFAIYLDEQGYIYVTGYGTAPLPHPWEQFLTIKYNLNGDVEWTATFNSPFIDDVPMHDRAKHLVVDKHGYVYVTGICMVIDFTTGHIHTDIGTVKYNPDGELVWSHIYGSEEEYDDEPVGIAVNKDGDVFIAATIITPDTLGRKSDFTVMMYDRDGNFKWVDRYKSSEDGDDRPYSITVDDYGNAYVAGYQWPDKDNYADFYITKYSTDGTKIWEDIIPGDATFVGYDRLLVYENEYIYAVGRGLFNAELIAKYDLAGNKLWTTQWDVLAIGGPLYAALDSEGNIYVSAEQWIDEEGTQMHVNPIAKFNSAGDMLWETRYECVDTNQRIWVPKLRGFGLDDEGNIYLGGNAWWHGEKFHTQNTYYAVKLVQTGGTDVRGEEVEYAFTLHQNYPNPFNPTTTIRYKIPAGDFVTLKIFDAAGREIAGLVNKYQQAGQYTVVFDATALSSGTYFYTLKIGGSVTTKKMLLIK